jgi:hypothetical protein
LSNISYNSLSIFLSSIFISVFRFPVYFFNYFQCIK